MSFDIGQTDWFGHTLGGYMDVLDHLDPDGIRLDAGAMNQLAEMLFDATCSLEATCQRYLQDWTGAAADAAFPVMENFAGESYFTASTTTALSTALSNIANTAGSAKVFRGEIEKESHNRTGSELAAVKSKYADVLKRELTFPLISNNQVIPRHDRESRPDPAVAGAGAKNNWATSGDPHTAANPNVGSGGTTTTITGGTNKSNNAPKVKGVGGTRAPGPQTKNEAKPGGIGHQQGQGQNQAQSAAPSAGGPQQPAAAAGPAAVTSGKASSARPGTSGANSISPKRGTLGGGRGSSSLGGASPSKGLGKGVGAGVGGMSGSSAPLGQMGAPNKGVGTGAVKPGVAPLARPVLGGGAPMRGAPMMGAPGTGGAGGKSGGGEHKTAGYLADARQGRRMLGRLPLVAPPVIGASPAATTAKKEHHKPLPPTGGPSQQQD